MKEHGWLVGQFVKDRYYHPDVIGVISSIKDRVMYVKFGDKNFKYSVDTDSLKRV